MGQGVLDDLVGMCAVASNTLASGCHAAAHCRALMHESCKHSMMGGQVQQNSSREVRGLGSGLALLDAGAADGDSWRG